jgi:hypothetical protein
MSLDPEHEPSPLAALAFGWLIPGAGHVYGGSWRKGVFFFLAILTLLAIGMYLGGGTVFQPNQLWFFPQLFAGGPGLALWPISAYIGTAMGIDWADRLHETGTLYTAVAGFLNALVMMDAYLRLAYPGHRSGKGAA